METVLIILGALLILTGVVGSLLPVIPGPPLAYVGLLVLQFSGRAPFDLQFFLIWGAIVIVVMVLENVIPAYGTKRFGGSVYGIWGTVIGLIVGLFFPPIGFIAGPILGAFAGEMISGKTSDKAFKSALGSFAGFLAGTLLKLIASVVMGYYFVVNL